MKSLIGVILVAACSTSPANVAGDYTIALTNKDNGCNFMNYTVGSTATGVGVTITQSGSTATATVTGVAALYLDGLLATHVFTGKVDGDQIDLTAIGTRTFNMGNCAYTFNGEILATLAGDALNGRIEYSSATNMGTDCGTLVGCVTTQDFNGTRPPP
jgi:hypothetical protein